MENPFLVFVAGADGLQRKTTFAQESSVKEVDSKSLSCNRYNSTCSVTNTNRTKTTITTTPPPAKNICQGGCQLKISFLLTL